MEFKEITQVILDETKRVWMDQLEQIEDFSPSGYLETLAFAEDQIENDKNSYRFGIIENGYARAVIEVTCNKAQIGYKWLKVLRIRTEPKLDPRNPNTASSNEFTRHKDRRGLLVQSLLGCFELSETDKFKKQGVKIYCANTTDFEILQSFVDTLDESGSLKKWGINVDTHKLWIEFSEII